MPRSLNAPPVIGQQAPTLIPLWRKLQAAAQAVRAVSAGRSLSDALAALSPELRPGAQALAFQTMRQWGFASALIGLLTSRSPDPAARALLTVVLAQWAHEQGAHEEPEHDESAHALQTRRAYEPFLLVDQAVEAAKQGRERALHAQAGFINAVLRRYLRERTALDARADADEQARWNHPRWWIERLRRDWPRDWQRILAAAQRAAPMALRVNVRHGTPAAYLERLAQAGIGACWRGDAAVLLDRARPVSQLPGFAEGLASVQSVTAQRAAPLLLTGLGRAVPRVLDACAAPGGKTTHLLELCPDARVTALDSAAPRAARIDENLKRLGLTAKVQVADAADTASWWDGAPFDAILLDAPCSASGILARHPDARWLRRPGDIEALARQQDRLLAALWPLLAPGGRLLYCTCSVFREEGADRIRAFLARNSQALFLPSPEHVLPVMASESGDNEICGEDGFYFALLERCG